MATWSGQVKKSAAQVRLRSLQALAKCLELRLKADAGRRASDPEIMQMEARIAEIRSELGTGAAV